MATRRKCFISYHKADENEVSQFIKDFGPTNFIHRRISEMDQNIVESSDTEYVMRRIRELYLTDSTVTIVLVGKCTWARRYVDWEVASTLRNDLRNGRSGLLAITLPSAANYSGKQLPARVADNVTGDYGYGGYARWMKYPKSSSELESWIEDAYNARTSRSSLIDNRRDRMSYNRTCP
jgi:hypothetical protein